jgi:hypothetical protein
MEMRWKSLFYVRSQPGVNSLTPARSALRAFGFAEFLSPIPNRLKSPPGIGFVFYARPQPDLLPQEKEQLSHLTREY